MKQTNAYVIAYIKAFAMICAAVFLDQWTKILAVSKLKNQGEIVMIPGVFQLHYLENQGAAFGILQGQKYYFIVSGILIIAVIMVLYHMMPLSKRYIPFRICAIFLTAGAVGNMIDRFRFQYVIDFLYFELIDFPIFNVADIYVTLSTMALVFLILFYYKEEDFQCFTLKKKF